MILHTGKYLNVIQQCNQVVVSPNAEEIVYTLDETQYVEKIKQSFTFASKKLVDLLMEEMDLMGRL
ncbi:Gamma-tubulin complex component 2, partial [Chamberlinius hualienensis]